MKIYDLSLKINSNLPSFPGDPENKLEPQKVYNKNCVNVLSICLGSHSGTHIDAPLHKLYNGDSLEEIPLDKFMGEAVFTYIPKERNEEITVKDLTAYDIRVNDIVIIMTGWEKNKYQTGYFYGFPYFSEDSADYLISKKIKCIGADIPSVDNPESEGVFHKKILGSKIVIIESLINLKNLIGRRLFFCAFPLNIEKGDGSPVRAIAIEGLLRRY